MTQEKKEMSVFKDGDAWCFVLPSFENLQTSESVWLDEGDTNMDLIYDELVEIVNPPEDEDKNNG